jgi:hypothetical protein
MVENASIKDVSNGEATAISNNFEKERKEKKTTKEIDFSFFLIVTAIFDHCSEGYSRSTETQLDRCSCDYKYYSNLFPIRTTYE